MNTATKLRKAAETLDRVWKDCTIARACGTTAGIVGGILAVGGGVSTILSPGIAAPLLSVAMGFGAAGALTNLGVSSVQASIESTEIKKAEKDLKETLDSGNSMNSTKNNVQLWLDRKEKARLLFMCFLAVQTLQGVGKLAGRLTVGISAAFLFFDVKHLRSTIKVLYLVKNKGSETATLLRQKADELDQIN